MALRWMEDGFHRPDAIAAEGKTTTRNLLGFKDGTANPSVGSDLFTDLVWVTPDDGEPAWATDGSYMAVRLIRMFVERWDRAPLAEQEAIIGRHQAHGRAARRPARGGHPGLRRATPMGTTTPIDAHIRLANPRHRGYGTQPHLPARLLLLARLRRRRAARTRVSPSSASSATSTTGSRPSRRASSNEPLAEYIQPQGGGFFFVLPGVVMPDGFLGETLLA